MNSLLEQLRDIEGLDSISPWPLAIGWWILLIIGLFIIGITTYFIACKWMFKRSWKNDTLQKLIHLEKNLSDVTARQTVMALSEYLRRVAIQRFSRKECAGLIGKDWLKWLTLHDPKNFDWEKKGSLLIDVPYAPLNRNLSIHQINELIQRVKDWVRYQPRTLKTSRGLSQINKVEESSNSSYPS